VELQESSPGNKVSLAKELQGKPKGLIIGVPAAFSPACSATHIPGYIKYEGLKEAGDVFVVSVNDAFVCVPLFILCSDSSFSSPPTPRLSGFEAALLTLPRLISPLYHTPSTSPYFTPPFLVAILYYKCHDHPYTFVGYKLIWWMIG